MPSSPLPTGPYSARRPLARGDGVCQSDPKFKGGHLHPPGGSWVSGDSHATSQQQCLRIASPAAVQGAGECGPPRVGLGGAGAGTGRTRGQAEAEGRARGLRISRPRLPTAGGVLPAQSGPGLQRRPWLRPGAPLRLLPSALRTGSPWLLPLSYNKRKVTNSWATGGKLESCPARGGRRGGGLRGRALGGEGGGPGVADGGPGRSLATLPAPCQGTGRKMDIRYSSGVLLSLTDTSAFPEPRLEPPAPMLESRARRVGRQQGD